MAKAIKFDKFDIILAFSCDLKQSDRLSFSGLGQIVTYQNILPKLVDHKVYETYPPESKVVDTVLVSAYNFVRLSKDYPSKLGIK